MTPADDGPMRAAYLRLADPVGTPARWIFLGTAFACLLAYGILERHGWASRTVPYLLVAGALYYAFRSLRARHLARRASAAEIRERFLEGAKAALDMAPSLPVRTAVWLGLGIWGWVTVFRGGDYPLGGNREMALFLAAMGTLLGGRYLYEWRVEIPSLRMLIGLAPLAPQPVPDRREGPHP